MLLKGDFIHTQNTQGALKVRAASPPFHPLMSQTPVWTSPACFFRFLDKIEPVASKPKHLVSTTSRDSDNKNTIARLGFGTGWLFDILTRTEGALAAFLQLQPLSMIMGYIADKYGTNENASIITVTHLCVLEARLSRESFNFYVGITFLMSKTCVKQLELLPSCLSQ